MEKSKTVCFSGCRPEKILHGGNANTHEVELIKFKLGQAILEEVALEQPRHFIIGMAERFDLWAGKAVADLRDAGHGNVTLETVVPFPQQGEKLRGELREQYINLICRADKMTLISDKYYRGVFHARSRYMVDSAGLLICYWAGQPGGTKYTIDYARKKGLTIINIHDLDDTESPIITTKEK